MDTNDLLQLEIDLINNRTSDELKKGYGSDGTTRSFLLNPIISYFNAENKNTRMPIQDFRFEISVQERGHVPKSKAVVTSVYYGENYGEQIELVHSYKYELQDLLVYMYDRWKLDHLKTYMEENACLLLFCMHSAEIKRSPVLPKYP
jgi:hypothetical protein